MVLAHAKNLVHELLLEGDIPDDPGVAACLAGYFPGSLRERYAAIRSPGHQLGREIIATRLANELIDRVGPGFIYRVEDRTGAGTDQVIRSVLVVSGCWGWTICGTVWRRTRLLPTIPVRHALERALEHNVAWLVRRKSRLGPIDDEVAVFQLRSPASARPCAAQPPLADGSAAGPGASQRSPSWVPRAELLTAVQRRGADASCPRPGGGRR